jgi:hypothetical protein
MHAHPKGIVENRARWIGSFVAGGQRASSGAAGWLVDGRVVWLGMDIWPPEAKVVVLCPHTQPPLEGNAPPRSMPIREG